MASKQEENVAEELSGRRTRSGRKTSVPPQPTTPRATRRSTRKHTQEEPLEVPQIVEAPVEVTTKRHPSIKEIVEMEVPQPEETFGLAEGHTEDSSDDIIYIPDSLKGDDSGGNEQTQMEEELLYLDGQGPAHISEDAAKDSEMYAVHEAPIEEKSSSFPFGMVGASETSEDAQNEDEEEATSEERNETGAVESSLLASLAGDNANSLPPVGVVGGAGEESDSKKDDFEAKSLTPVSTSMTNMEKIDSEDSEPAIAEDLANGDDSNATIENTEMISEDELPLPVKPEIRDAEEVSDEELPAPPCAELPPDAEVISEDELPVNTSGTESRHADSRATSSEHGSGKKRKAPEDGESHKTERRSTTEGGSRKRNDAEQYNPMSPTSESSDTAPPEKKSRIEDTHEHREKRREKERSKDKERDKDKDREREREKDKEKERKKLPDLEKYWRAVKEDPADFTGWTYLLQYVDTESDAEAAREAYDAFLSHYPYCYGYWRKYADYEKRKGLKANCHTVFERGLKAIPLSVDLWIHYLVHIKTTNPDNDEYIRLQFKRAIDACGLEFRSDKLWDAYIKWESDAKRFQRVTRIYDRLLTIPTQGYSGHFDNFQDFIKQHSILSTISAEEIKRIRIELRESSAKSSSRSKSSSGHRDGHSREKDDAEAGGRSPTTHRRESSDDTNKEKGTKAPDADRTVENAGNLSTLTDDECAAIKDRVIALRRKVHKATVAAVTERWSFEEGIKRPYFHVKPLERCQLKNWKDYLDFEIERGDRKRILVLFERCLIACALYDEFWLKMLRYLETQADSDPAVVPLMRDVYRRACDIHHPDKPSLHLMWSAFEECQKEFDNAARILVQLEQNVPNLLQIAYRRINVERRRGDLEKCRRLYEHYIHGAKNKTLAGTLSIKYARFLNKVCGDLEGGMRVLRQALEKDASNTRVALQMIDLALQRPTVNEVEVVEIMDQFMARDCMEVDQKILFAQRKVEFLEDFGSTAQGLQDAQRALQAALSKANEEKKKKESSPSRQSEMEVAEGQVSSGGGYGSASTAAAANSSYGYGTTPSSAYYSQTQGGGSAAYQHQSAYDGYYNQWQYGASGYSGYGQWSGGSGGGYGSSGNYY